MKKHIFVTGGAGFIGSHTCVALLEAGYELVVVDDYSNSRPEVLDAVREIAGRGFFAYQGDVRDASVLDKIFRAHDIAAVVHFAGWKAVGESVEKPLVYYDNNVGGAVSLLQAMQRANCKTIVFSSSATVYGLHNSSPYREEYETAAYNPYGKTKVMIEEILRDVHAADGEWRVASLRYFNPIGAHPTAYIGEEPNGIPDNLVPFIVQTAAGIRKKLKIHIILLTICNTQKRFICHIQYLF